MFFEPPTLTAEDATAFPADDPSAIDPAAWEAARVTINRAMRRKLAREHPAYRAARKQERPFRRAFGGIAHSRARLLALRAGEALR